MSEKWLVTRTKDGATEYLCEGNTWNKEKAKAHPMFEEYAKGTVNGLRIIESGRKRPDPYRYDTVVE